MLSASGQPFPRLTFPCPLRSAQRRLLVPVRRAFGSLPVSTSRGSTAKSPVPERTEACSRRSSLRRASSKRMRAKEKNGGERKERDRLSQWNPGHQYQAPNHRTTATRDLGHATAEVQDEHVGAGSVKT